jgi:hypothetical protein
VGRVVVARVAGGELRVEHGGRMDPETSGDMLDQRDWGQAVGFVPDADGDGVPDLVVTGPWTMAPDGNVDLVSTARWQRITKAGQVPLSWIVLGHWLDVSSDGTTVLVGGTAERGMPENLMYAGVLHVLDARTLKKVTSVRLPPQPRDR